MPKHFQYELDKLKRKLFTLTALVEEIVTCSVEAALKRDRELAKKVYKMDDKIDDLEVEVEEDCLKILALHQPVAIDLRYIVGVLKVNNDLERIGDLAVNIAQRARTLGKLDPINYPFNFEEMAQKVFGMIDRAIKSLITMDVDLAQNVWNDDEEVDQLHRQMYKKVYSAIKKTPLNAEILIQYLSISRNLERMADYTTNIAEDVIYMVDGRIVRHNPDLMSEASGYEEEN